MLDNRKVSGLCMINLKPQVLKQKPFVLLSKEVGIPASTRRIVPERLGFSEPTSFDVAIISSTTNPNQRKIITTFRDEQNRPLELIQQFVGYDKPETHKIFSYLPNYGQKNLSGRLVKTMTDKSPSKNYHAWSKTSYEKQYVKRNENNDITELTVAKVVTDGNLLGQVKDETHSLTEYSIPKTHGGERKPNRYIKFNTTKDENGIPQITSHETSSDVKFPENDKYLAMRIYDAYDAKFPMARTALEENGLKNLKIEVEDTYNLGANTSGQFDHRNGVLSFNYKNHSKPELIDTAYHEAKHALQYATMAVTGDLADTPYGRNCVSKCKSPITPYLKTLSKEYLDAHVNYVQASENYEAYRNNLLEVEAWDRGYAGLENYLDEGIELSSQFRNIPKSEL